MRRVSLLRLVSIGLVATLGLLIAASGCADNNSTLFIRGVMSQSGSDCVFEPDGESPLLGSGVMDVAVRSTYVMPLLVGNQLIARGDADKLRTETARVVIRGAVVEVTSADGSRTYASFSTNAGGFIDPASGENPGYGITFVNAISGELAGELRGSLALGESEELNVSVYVYGDTLGNDEVESSTLTYPLFACNGCLVDCSTGNLSSGSCKSYPEDGLEVGCFPGQDTLTPCQLVLTDPDPYCPSQPPP